MSVMRDAMRFVFVLAAPGPPAEARMPMPATQIRRGNVILFNGEPHRVIEFHHHTPGNLRAFVQAKMRNLKTGAMTEHRFRAADTVEKAQMQTHELQFMYKDAHHYHFMNTSRTRCSCSTTRRSAIRRSG
jgi:translation elongation factor P/translation initiation factor 5A